MAGGCCSELPRCEVGWCTTRSTLPAETERPPGCCCKHTPCKPVTHPGRALPDRRGAVARIDPVSGKTISERVGSAVILAKFLARMPGMLLTVTADGYAMFTNYTSGILVLSIDTRGSPVVSDNEQAAQPRLVTCGTIDAAETTILVGKPCGALCITVCGCCAAAAACLHLLLQVVFTFVRV